MTTDENNSLTSESSSFADQKENGIGTRSLGLSVEVYLQNGRLVFNNELEFETGMHDLKGLDVMQWNTDIGFFSMWKPFNTEHTTEEIEEMDDLPFDDEALMAVLNPCGIVQINPWIFKLNANTRVVHVLPVSKASKAGLLCQDAPVDPDIVAYSFDDGVFDLLENSGSFCPEDCAGSSQDGDGMSQYCSRVINGKTVKFERKGKVKYDRAGIWKVFKIKFKHNCTSGCGAQLHDNTTFAFVYEAAWKKKCEGQGNSIQAASNIVNELTGTLFWNTYFDNKAVKEFYSGTRCLSFYRIHAPATQKAMQVYSIGIIA